MRADTQAITIEAAPAIKRLLRSRRYPLLTGDGS
jgi:hypothetical protein